MNPSGRLLLLLAVASAAPLAVALFELPYLMGFALTAVVLGAAVWDRIAGVAAPVKVERRLKNVLSVGTQNRVELVVRNHGDLRLALTIVDEPPENGVSEPAGAQTVVVPGQKSAVITYQFTPNKRGKVRFTGVQFRFTSRMGFWLVKKRLPVVDAIQVYPNIEAISRFELLARQNSLAELGFSATRMKGDGTEFERMREYREGDDPRRVDWKTTSRLGKLIVREMGQDRNQNILFMIDVGRMMRQETDGLSHLDYALNTAIILAHIAQRNGDNVGAVLFSDEVKVYVPLTRGRGAVDSLVQAVYDVKAEPVATNYRHAFKHVMRHVNKRSLLLMMTHFVPGEDQALIRAFTAQLGRRHLPLCLFFKEPSLSATLASPPLTINDTFRKAAAAGLLMERVEGLKRLREGGVFALDALPGEYSAAAINHYLDIKARNLL